MKELIDMKRSRRQMCIFLYTCDNFTCRTSTECDAYDILVKLSETLYVKRKNDTTFTLTEKGKRAVLSLNDVVPQEYNFASRIPDSLPKETIDKLPDNVQSYIRKLQILSKKDEEFRKTIHVHFLEKYDE